MFSKLWQWLSQSHRLHHLVGGFAVGFLCGIVAAVSVAAALEFKDKQWGGKPDWIDFVLTVLGGLVGGMLRLFVVWLVIKPLFR